MDESFHSSLTDYADDAEVQIVSCSPDELVIRVRFASGNRVLEFRTPTPVHLDMSPVLTLGATQFGGLDLLPTGYIQSRNLDYGGKGDKYRVWKLTDNDEKTHYVVYYGHEQIVPTAD